MGLYDDIKDFVATAGKINVRVFSYQKDFEFLWNLLIDKTSIAPGIDKIIIVWDGMPEYHGRNSVNINKYLTPFDWAAGFSIHRIDATMNRYPDYDIIIVNDVTDLEGAENIEKIITHVMPWVVQGQSMLDLPAALDVSVIKQWQTDPTKMKWAGEDFEVFGGRRLHKTS